MGTNYYYDFPTERPICDYCGRGDATTTLHIGKASVGWVFALRIHPKYDIIGLESWKSLWDEGGRIHDEYGHTISQDLMLRIITECSADASRFHAIPPGYANWDDFHEKNQSEFGPKGLLRLKLRSKNLDSIFAPHLAVAHEDSWDLLDRDFS